MTNYVFENETQYQIKVDKKFTFRDLPIHHNIPLPQEQTASEESVLDPFQQFCRGRLGH